MHNIAMQNKFVFVYCCLGMASNSAHGLNDDVFFFFFFFFFFSSGLSWCLMNQISPSAGLYGECHNERILQMIEILFIMQFIAIRYTVAIV